MWKTSIAAIAVLTLLCAIAVHGQDKPAPEKVKGVSLDWKWTKGDVLTLKHTEVRKSGDKAAKTFDTESTTTTTYRHEVKDVVKDGNATVALTYKTVAYESKSPRENVKWDSTKDPEAAAVKELKVRIFARLINKGINLTLSPRGEIKAIEGVEKLVKAVLDSMADEEQKLVSESLPLMLSDDLLKAAYASFYRGAPDKQVAIGDSWEISQQTPIPTMGKLSQTFKFKLDSVGAGSGGTGARIKITGIETRIEDWEKESLGKRFEISISDDSGSGEIEVSLSKGRINTLAFKQSYILSLKARTGDRAIERRSVSENKIEFSSP